jgi:VanZ family protein
MAFVPRRPTFWLAAFFVWFVVLWILSSSTHPKIPAPPAPPLPFFDKVEHFGYFFGGAGLLAAGLFFRKPSQPRWHIILPSTIIIVALVGWLDEYHQGFVPGRSGNDPFDWLADFTGAISGAFAFKRIHRRLS